MKSKSLKKIFGIILLSTSLVSPQITFATNTTNSSNTITSSQAKKIDLSKIKTENKGLEKQIELIDSLIPNEYKDDKYFIKYHNNGRKEIIITLNAEISKELKEEENTLKLYTKIVEELSEKLNEFYTLENITLNLEDKDKYFGYEIKEKEEPKFEKIIGFEGVSGKESTPNGKEYVFSDYGDYEKVSNNLKSVEEKKKAEEEKKWAEYDDSITYKQLSRTPDSYTLKKLRISGKVIQVVEDENGVTLRVAKDGDYDSVMLVSYKKDLVKERILEDDYVTLYGTYAGLFTYTSSMNVPITVPSMLAHKVVLE